jgi:hypothetical protein
MYILITFLTPSLASQETEGVFLSLHSGLLHSILSIPVGFVPIAPNAQVLWTPYGEKIRLRPLGTSADKLALYIICHISPLRTKRASFYVIRRE